MRELNFVRSGRLAWRERSDAVLVTPTDALVRPFVAGRCDGDCLPLHRPVSRPMQLGLKLGLIDPVVASIVGDVPFQGPFGIGHECVAQVTAVGDAVSNLQIGDVVVVPWSVSCGMCRECRLGLTAKCSTMSAESPGGTLAAFGFGPTSGAWGGMIADSLRIPFAEHLLVKVPEGVDPLRVASASDNLADALHGDGLLPEPRHAPPRDGYVLEERNASRRRLECPPGFARLARVHQRDWLRGRARHERPSPLERRAGGLQSAHHQGRPPSRAPRSRLNPSTG